MNREELENTELGTFTEFGGHKNLLVSFGGIKQGLGIPVFEFFNSIADIPCDKIFLRDFNQAWYQKGVDAELNHIDKITVYLKETIEKKGYENVCFLGNSMGGYAAILFGTLLNVNTVIAFAPQTFVDRINRILQRDFRWRQQISRVHSNPKKRKDYFDLNPHLASTEYDTELNIYYSPNHRLDNKHATRLKGQKHVVLHAINEGGHSIAKTVRNNGELTSLIRGSFKL